MTIFMHVNRDILDTLSLNMFYVTTEKISPSLGANLNWKNINEYGPKKFFIWIDAGVELFLCKYCVMYITGSINFYNGKNNIFFTQIKNLETSQIVS